MASAAVTLPRAIARTRPESTRNAPVCGVITLLAFEHFDLVAPGVSLSAHIGLFNSASPARRFSARSTPFVATAN
jgi:hypothetical protein